MDLRLQGKSTIKKLFIGIAVLFIVALVYLLRAQKETQVQNTAIYINEVCPANLSVVKNSRKEFPKGWVELYNAGEETVSLKDYCLPCGEVSLTLDSQARETKEVAKQLVGEWRSRLPCIFDDW